MPITGHGWELYIKRLAIQQSQDRARTYGAYQAFREGKPIANLSGNVCECPGPGNNTIEGSKTRIAEGTYPLSTQFGRYCTIGYSQNLQVEADPPMPAIKVENTGSRIGILIHPAHPPDLFLSSIGCLNPSKPLEENDEIDFWDSRARVIALIDDLQTFCPRAFAQLADTPIAAAWLVVDGEPVPP